VAKTANVLVQNNSAVNNSAGCCGETFQLIVSGSSAGALTYNLTVTNNSFTNLSASPAGNEVYMEVASAVPSMATCLDFTGNGTGAPSVTLVKNAQPFVIRNRDSIQANNATATFTFSPSQASFGTQTGACTQPTPPPI
jgi:hypothetical protein